MRGVKLLEYCMVHFAEPQMRVKKAIVTLKAFYACRIRGDLCHVIQVRRWNDMAAVRIPAGESPRRSRGKSSHRIKGRAGAKRPIHVGYPLMLES